MRFVAIHEPLSAIGDYIVEFCLCNKDQVHEYADGVVGHRPTLVKVISCVAVALVDAVAVVVTAVVVIVLVTYHPMPGSFFLFVL